MARRPKLQNVPLPTMTLQKAFRANGICMPLHKTRKPTWSRLLVCSIACLPDERHITGLRLTSDIIDTDGVCAGHLDLHRVGGVDVYDVGSHCGTLSRGDGRGDV